MAGKISFSTVALLILTGVILTSACTAIQIGGELTLKNDGSGNRTFILYIYNSDNKDGCGNAYFYSKLHGDALKKKIEDTFKSRLNESSWLTVSVSTGTGLDGKGDKVPTELVTIAFNFTSFDDYIDKTTRLAKFGGSSLPAGSKFSTPTLQNTRATTFRYREAAEATLWTLKPLFLALVDDPDVFDITAGGANYRNKNDGYDSTIENLKFFGLETKAVPIVLNFGSNRPKTIASGSDINEQFNIAK